MKYNEDRAVISIGELKVLEGGLPKRALSGVLEWANEHCDELMNNGLSLQTTGEITKYCWKNGQPSCLCKILNTSSR